MSSEHIKMTKFLCNMQQKNLFLNELVLLKNKLNKIEIFNLNIN